MNDKPKISVTESRKIFKYAEGAIPDVDEPFEIIEQAIVHTGDDAIRLLKQMGGNIDGIN